MGDIEKQITQIIFGLWQGKTYIDNDEKADAILTLLKQEGWVEPDKMRKSVRDFALNMEALLQKNDHKGGWDKEGLLWLYARAMEELGELGAALLAVPTKKKGLIGDEAADVANFCMMIADKVQKQGEC